MNENSLPKETWLTTSEAIIKVIYHVRLQFLTRFVGSKPHVCDHAGCGKSFLRPAHLQIHMRIHTGEKPFVCTFEGCGKRWNQKSALKQHMRSHTGEKPFLCSIEGIINLRNQCSIIQGCGKNFSTSSSCKRHILTHMKEGQNPPSPIQIGDDRSPLSKRKSTDSLSDSSSDDEYDLPLTKRPSRELAQPKMNLDFILN